VAGPYKDLKNYWPQDWNQIGVVVRGGVACCTCNGEVLEAELKVPETGSIGLEGDRGQMEYRHIQIKQAAAGTWRRGVSRIDPRYQDSNVPPRACHGGCSREDSRRTGTVGNGPRTILLTVFRDRAC
jgi:hypothetical protein